MIHRTSMRMLNADETPEVNGVSHFLEHMAFKGTEKFTADDVNRIFDEVGAEYNASTSEEVTIFYANILPEYLPQTFEVLSGILFPTLRQDDFDMEKNVILEEISMYQDQPMHIAYENAMLRHFTGHPLGVSILGTLESVGDLTSEQMRQYQPLARRPTRTQRSGSRSRHRRDQHRAARIQRAAERRAGCARSARSQRDAVCV